MHDPVGDDASTDDIDEIRCSLDSQSRPLFEAAYRAHHRSLLQFLRRRVGSEADVRDIAQEAYLRSFRYRENQSVESLGSLLFRIARNLAGMRARSARAHHWIDHLPLGDEFGLVANDPPPERQVSDGEQLDRLMEAIERLPVKCQQVFVLSRFHNMSYGEIAARCNISVKMVEKHITNALRICRTAVGEDLP